MPLFRMLEPQEKFKLDAMPPFRVADWLVEVQAYDEFLAFDYRYEE